MTSENKDLSWLYLTLAAAAVLMITMGARQSQGLFVFPIAGSTGVGIVTISFAMAVGQFMWGAGSAHRRRARRPLRRGAGARRRSIDPRGGNGVDAVSDEQLGSRADDRCFHGDGIRRGQLFRVDRFAVALSAAGPARHGRRDHHRRRFIRTICLCADHAKIDFPVGLDGRDVVAGRADVVGVAVGAAPRRIDESRRSDRLASPSGGGMRATLRSAFGNYSYLLLHGSFLTCGFHIAFLVTHLPGEVDLCGLPASVASWSLAIIGLSNIAGSFTAGWLLSRFRGKTCCFGCTARARC